MTSTRPPSDKCVIERPKDTAAVKINGLEPGSILTLSPHRKARSMKLRAEAATAGDLDCLEVIWSGQVIKAVQANGRSQNLSVEYEFEPTRTGLLAARREMLRKVMPVADITPMDLYPLKNDRPIWVLHVARPYGDWAVVELFNWDRTPAEMPPYIEEDRLLQIVGHNQHLLGEPLNFGSKVSSLKAAQHENHRLESLAEKPPGLELLPVPAYLKPPAPRRIVLNFARAGLDPDREYVLYDFWNSKFLGRMQKEYSAVLPAHACQVISLRPFLARPQVIGTDRHITMGVSS